MHFQLTGMKSRRVHVNSSKIVFIEHNPHHIVEGIDDKTRAMTLKDEDNDDSSHMYNIPMKVVRLPSRANS